MQPREFLHDSLYRYGESAGGVLEIQRTATRMNCLILLQEEAQQRREHWLAWRVGEGGEVRAEVTTLAVGSESWWRHENLVWMALRLNARAVTDEKKEREKRLFDGDDDRQTHNYLFAGLAGRF